MEISEPRIEIFFEMEERYRRRDAEYFRRLLKHPDFTIRARATCVLAEIAGREHIKDLAEVLLHDENPIVRHEAAYSLGQLGYREATPYLVKSLKTTHTPSSATNQPLRWGLSGAVRHGPTLSKP